MKKVYYLLALAALMLLPLRIARADDGSGHDRLIIGQNFTLGSGEILDGGLVVIAGEATIEPDAVVHGDLVVIAGNLRLDGRALGSAVVIGGNAALGQSSSVQNDLVALGGSFQREAGAQIGGDIITNLSIPTESLPRATAAPDSGPPPEFDYRFDFGPLGTVVGVLVQAVALGLVAMLLSAFLRPQVDRVAQAAQSQVFAAGSLGLLTLFLAPFAIVVLAITVILFPVALAAAFLLILAWLFGMVAVGQIVGEQLMRAFHRDWEPVLATGIGAFAVGITLGVSNQIPCVGWMAGLLIGLVGLGASTMTLFGTRSQFRTSAPQVNAVTSAEADSNRSSDS